MRKQLQDVDCYNRRSNLIFEGINEPGDEEKDKSPWDQVAEIIKNDLKIDPSQIKVERCHRLYNSRSDPKPIIVRFNWFADRDTIWQKRMALKESTKNSHVYIREDFSWEVQKSRRNWSHTLTAARKLDKKATLKQDKLLFRGKLYEEGQVPSEVMQAGVGPSARLVNGHVCFSGRASAFSNFHYSPFRANGMEWRCNEQYFQYHKAKHAKDDEAAAAIYAETDPAEMKRIGDAISGENWYGDPCMQVMAHGILHKFQQNPDLNALMTKCSQYRFVECSQYDKYWGNGLKWTARDVGNPSKWKGKKMPSVSLNVVAKRFRVPYSQAVRSPRSPSAQMP